MQTIDCHTHLQTKELVNEYFKNRGGYAIAIKALDDLIGNGDIFYEVANDKRLFIIECIDVLKNIPEQLAIIKEHLNIYPNIIGIKIYLGYQPIYADDAKLYPVYNFAQENNLSMCFHCGLCASNLNQESDLSYSSCLPIEKVSKKFPLVKFIVSHFDYPNFMDCARIILENDNVYTDISGEYEYFDNKPAEQLMNDFIKEISPIFNVYSQEKLSNKIMFGTDYFGIDSGFELVEEYIETIKKLFGDLNLDRMLFKNCLNAYPRIQTILEKTYNDK